jgi:predicted aminopeptidase
MAYIALKRMLFGPQRLEVGDEVPFEPNRDYGLMLRQGLIADTERVAATAEQHEQDMEGARARIRQLEGLLADARAELQAVQGEPAKTAKKASRGAAVAAA